MEFSRRLAPLFFLLFKSGEITDFHACLLDVKRVPESRIFFVDHRSGGLPWNKTATTTTREGWKWTKSIWVSY